MIIFRVIPFALILFAHSAFGATTNIDAANCTIQQDMPTYAQDIKGKISPIEVSLPSDQGSEGAVLLLYGELDNLHLAEARYFLHLGQINVMIDVSHSPPNSALVQLRRYNDFSTSRNFDANKTVLTSFSLTHCDGKIWHPDPKELYLLKPNLLAPNSSAEFWSNEINFILDEVALILNKQERE